MKKVKIFFVILVSILVLSCTKEKFSTSSLSLRRYIEYDEDDIKREHLIFQFLPSKQDASYFFIIKSPDGDLSWEGRMYKNGTLVSSENISITPSSSFPEGKYSYIIYSDNGLSINGEVSMPDEEEGHATYTQELDRSIYDIKFFDKNGVRTYTEESAIEVEIDYRDKFKNFVIVREKIKH